MDTLFAVGLLVVGLILLAGGGEALVRAATTLAELAGVSPAVIGLTVVAIGTSLPELVVSLVAATEGQPDLAIANVVGSNIFNITATLGLTALILPLPVHGQAVKLEWPVMFVASFMCLLVARDGRIDRVEGGFFLVAMVMFIAYTVRVARKDVVGAERQQLTAQVEARDIDTMRRPARPRLLLVSLSVLAAGIVGLVIGGRLLVDGAVSLARLAGMTERVIGLTIVAAGTGAPELATSMVAAYRKRTDVAVANMIGSNIFNIFGILGVTALVAPVPVPPAMVASDMRWMIGSTLLLLPLLRSEARLSRAEGGLLLTVYGVYLTLLLRA
ncbi:MAG TPA: calcium/sodium antiporter [Gemmatimonadaceae bacterium]|nr:calcium/sodium antiporter [Gemmatimonadaceae bacterium]